MKAQGLTSGGGAGGSVGEESSPAAGLTQGSLLSVSSTLPSGRPSPAHHMGYIRSGGLEGNVHGWKQASILVDSGSQQQDLISHAFADRLGVKGVLKGAAAQADGTRIPLYDVGNLQLSVNGVPTVRRFQRADIKPFDVILGESFCEDQSVVIDYAHAKLWQLKPGTGILPLVLNEKPSASAQAASSFLMSSDTGRDHVLPLPGETQRSSLLADVRYREALWVFQQGESSARLQEIDRQGTRAGEDSYLNEAVMAAHMPAPVRDWDIPQASSCGSRVRRLQRRHPSSLLQVIDFQKELPEDEELDEREVPGLPAKPECSFAFIEADVREHLGHLEDSMVESVVARLRSFEADVFETRSMPRAPPHRPIDLDITLRQDAEPIARRAYPVAAHHLPELDRQIQLLLNAGMIRPSFSDYAAPILFTPKKDGKLRLVCDYRALNAQTVRDRFPTPTAADLISSTTGGRLFSKIDLLAGFHQLRVRESDIHKTAFVTPRGQYEWLTAPFGLSATPSAFQRLMTMVLEEHIRAGYCCVYLDDVCIWTKTDDPLEHLAKVEAVLASLREHSLIAKGSKCEFFRTEMEFLGFMVGKDGVRPVPGKVEAVQQVPAPETVSQLRSFLGMVGFFRNHIQGFAEVSAPLTDLLRGVRHGRQRLPWSLDCEQSFRHLKEVLTTAPVLRHFDPTLRTAVHVDGSQNAVGAVLLQWEDGEETPRPVCFLSRKLQGAQFRYDARNVEALAAQIALSVWRPLLYGVRFELISDHASLVSLLTQKALSPRLLRLCEFLADFNFEEVRYIRGSDNVVPDFLSRPWGHSGEDAITSPLHLLSHPRTRRDEAAVAAGVQLGDDTLRYVSLLVCRGAEVVVGSSGGLLRLPQRRCGGRTPLEVACSLRDEVLGVVIEEKPTLVAAVAGVELWQVTLQEQSLLSGPWVWRLQDDLGEPQLWGRGYFAMLMGFGFVAEGPRTVLLAMTHEAPDSLVLQKIRQEQESDVFLSQVREQVHGAEDKWWRDFFFHDEAELLCYRRAADPVARVCVPASCRAQVLEAAHGGSSLTGHPGIARTAAAVARFFYWPRLYEDVAHFVRSCRVCAAAKSSNQLRMGAESFTTIPIEPFSHWAMDLIGPLPRSRSGNSWIVTWVDRTSKWIVARAMKTGSCSGKDLAELTFAEICCNYGLPARLTHDNDVRFKKFWRSLWTLVGTKITATAAWNPQADPAERANRQVQEAMRAAVTTVGSYDEWDKALPHICFGLNTQVSSVTGISPFELLHGFAARTPISLGSSSVNGGKQERAAYDMALENANRYKAAADRAAAEQARVGRILAGRRSPATVKVGDWVWMDGAHVPDQIPHKLAMRWYGPYEVLEVFAGGGTVRLRLPEELGRISTVVNIRRLKFSELRDAELSTEDDRLVEPLVGPDGPRYEVERIVMHRDRAGQKEMFVHWKGYDASHGRWVSRASLAQDVPGLVAAYERSPSTLVARRSAPTRAPRASVTPLVVGGVRRSPRICVQHLHWLGGSGPVWA